MLSIVWACQVNEWQSDRFDLLRPAVALQSVGKVLVAGFWEGGDFDFALWRFNASGSLDSSFHEDAFNVADFGEGNDYSQAIIVQPDGKIVVAGFAADGGTDDFALARFDTK